MAVDVLVILDVQHAGKVRAPADRGAALDLDGDGTIEAHEAEAELTPIIMAAAAEQVVVRGGMAVPICSGEYPERHAHARNLVRRIQPRRAAYVALHLNAGDTVGDGFGLVVHDRRSKQGRLLAERVGAEMARFEPDVRIRRDNPRGERWERNWHATIGGAYSGPPELCGILYEPMYLQRLAGRSIAEQHRLLGIAGTVLADGILAWAREA